MCGICGVAGGDPGRERGNVEAMTAALAHRGPDDEGVAGNAHVVLGNRRLSIIDLSAAAHQPIMAEDGASMITYNGEVYNFPDLRDELEADGYRFRSRTDTEVVLALYMRHGQDSVRRLRGMFAFAIWDASRRRLFAARDHFGQKPFYYAVHDQRLLFSSEIKSLLAHPDVPAEPEPAAADYYLSLRMIPPPLTMFRGIRKLPPGHWLQWNDGELRIERYWSPGFEPGAARSEREWIEELRSRIDESVSAHRISDVPVGAFLSGGLDSSVVVSSLARADGDPIRTFCVGSDDVHFDERSHARLMADHAGTVHHETCVRPDLLDRIPQLVRRLDEPSDPIAACFDSAAQLAAGHVKVVLGGDGGDELFGGFDRYAAFRVVSRYAALPRWLREDVVRPVVRAVPESFAYKSVSQRARWLDNVASERGGRLYARMTAHFRFSPEARRAMYGPALRDSLSRVDTLDAIAAPFDAAPSTDPLDRMIYADLMTRLPEHTLMLADRLAMAHGLEVRSPLLDVPLAEFCLSMPADLRIRRWTTKYALRQAARPWLPAPLLRRSKQGFMFPVARWLDGRAMARVVSGVGTGPLVREGWILPGAVDELAAEHSRGQADHHVRLWQLASLDAWYRMYIHRGANELDGEPARSSAVVSPTG